MTMEVSSPGADHNTNSSKVIKVSHNLQRFNAQGDNLGSIFIFHLGVFNIKLWPCCDKNLWLCST